jgi:type III secretion system FlhB-like substrate exporter
MPDYKDFINKRIAYYEELAGKKDACKVIGKATGELSAKAIEKAEILSGISIKEEQK